MAERFFPLAGFPLATEDDWRLFVGKLVTSGVWAGYLSALAVTADGSGMTVQVAPGGAVIMGFYYESDAQRTPAIGAAHATLPRIDTVVVRVDRTVSPVTYTTAVVAGAPNASPSAPALTQTTTLYELPLADVRVNAAVGTITSDKVTDRRTYAVPSLQNGSIGTALLAADAVDNSKLADNAVGTPQLSDGVVTVPKLADISAAYRKVGAADTDTSTVRAYDVETDTRRTTYAYDVAGRITTATTKDASGVTTVGIVTYAFNADGTVATETEVAGGRTIVTTYGYVAGTTRIASETRTVS